MRALSCVPFLFCLAVIALPADAARNLLVDGQFDAMPGSSGSAWQVSGNGSVLPGTGGYLGNDYADAPSVRLQSLSGQSVTIEQCISVDLPAGAELAFSVLGYAHASTGGEGLVQASFVVYGQDVCGSTDPLPVALLHTASLRGLQPGRFGELRSAEPLTLGASVKSVQVRIRTEAGAGSVRDYSWDDARLMLLNPVESPVVARYWHQNVEGVSDSAEIGDGFGSALAVADFNGDGFDDLAIGSPFEDRTAFNVDYVDAGLVQVIYGGPDGLHAGGSQQLGAMPFLGLQGNAHFGAALAAGDIDGDGHADLVIGSPGSSDDGQAAAGAVFVSFGGAAGLSGLQRLQQSSPQIGRVVQAGDRLGASLAAGDVNGDGLADIAVGVPGDSLGLTGPDSGAVIVLYGASDGLQGSTAPLANQFLHQNLVGLPGAAVPGNQFGYSVLLHDMDSDGRDDLVVGVPFADNEASNAGLVYLLFATDTGIGTVGHIALLPADFGETQTGNHFFGSALSGGEIVLGPSLHRSLMIGAPGASSGGVTGHGRGFRYAMPWFLSTVGTPECIDQGPSPGEFAEQLDSFGATIAVADMDGDGLRNDELIGAPGEDNAAGSLHLRIARQPAPIERALRQSDIGGAHEVGDRFGAAVARGNFNGRGADELAIAVPDEGVGSTAGAGAVVELGFDPLPDVLFADGFEASSP